MQTLYKEDLRAYQLVNKDHIINNPHSGLFSEMGLGKTVSSLTAVDELIYELLEINNVLIIAPKRVAESVWDKEIDRWDHLKHLTVSKIMGTEKQRRKALKQKADVYIVSRDNIAWLCGVYGGSMLPFDMCIIDESSSFKNHASQRFKALRMAQPSFKRVVILTGTPAPNGLIDLWAQIYLLDRGKRLGRYIGEFRKNYFTPGQRNGMIVFNYRIDKGGDVKIHEKIKDICLSMKSKDYLELPEVIHNRVEIKLDSKTQARYDEFEREQVLSLVEEEEEITAVNAAVLSNKLLQYAAGAIYDEDKNYHAVHDLKIKALKDIVEDSNGSPILIGYWHKHSLERMQKALKEYNPVAFSKPQDVDDWNEGKIQVMFIHPAAGGHGLNLQFGGHTLVWFEIIWNLELKLQLDKRLHRPGQQHGVGIHELVAIDTIDLDVIKAQEAKSNTQDRLMEAVKARFDKYRKELN